jgi:hypothetical protein
VGDTNITSLVVSNANDTSVPFSVVSLPGFAGSARRGVGTVETTATTATAAVGTSTPQRPAPVTTRAGRVSAWGLSLLATGASTYALEGIATAAGLLLAASGVLDGMAHGLLVAALALSYVVWAVALRTNLRENHTLLIRTGMSTNVLSKVAHDVAAARSSRPQVLRLASSAGYVASEVVKEVPYYAGAFGATVLTDSVSSAHALVFLIGTNLGAGAYEHGLARLTRLLLARTPTRT